MRNHCFVPPPPPEFFFCTPNFYILFNVGNYGIPVRTCELRPARWWTVRCDMRVETCALRTVGRATWLFRQSLLPSCMFCTSGVFPSRDTKTSMTNCTKCSAVVGNNARFCSECGAASCALRDDELRDATCELRPPPCVPWVERPGYSDKAFFFAARRAQDAARMSKPEFHRK